jgi:signal transduction histidine kinase/DNA-binding response OmpR family regulator/streptogramin lyase
MKRLTAFIPRLLAVASHADEAASHQGYGYGALTLLLAALYGAMPVAAQQLPYRQHTPRDGLSHEHIRSLAQAEDGRLWIGTTSGLSVYDGETFRRVALPDSMRQGLVNSVHARPDGSAWVSVRGQGLARVRGERVVRTVPTPHKYLRRIVERGDTLHFFMRQALWTLSPGEKQFQRQPYKYRIELNNPQAGRGARDAAIAPDGSRWILDSERGLARLHEDGTVRFMPTPPEALPDWETLRFTERGTALVACNDGRVYRFDPETEQFEELFRSPDPVAYIRIITQGNRRIALLGTHGGVERYDLTQDRRLSSLHEARGLPPRLTRAVLRDHEGGLWLGTAEGLFHLYAPGVRRYTSLDDHSLSYAGMFTTDKRGRLWLQTRNSGVFRLTPDVAHFSPGSTRVHMPLESRSGYVHAVGAIGWYRYEPERGWKQLASRRTKAMRGYVSRRGVGYFWHNDGLYRHAPDGTPPTQLMGWKKEEVDRHAFTLAPDGRLVVRAEDRLLRGVPQDSARTRWQFKEIAQLSGYADARGYLMGADATGAVWLSFWDRGLVRVDPNKQPASVRQVAPGRFDHVTTVGDSLVLAGSVQGLVIARQGDGAVLRRLTRSDGLLSTHVSDAMIYRDSLYASHPTGITIMPLPDLNRSESSPRTLLTSIERNGSALAPSDTSAFSAENRTVGFDFAATTFARPQRTRYEYRLTPHDTAWRTSRRAFMRYTDLAPGRYRFEVRARNAPNAAPGSRATYGFTIPPRFYETAWFQLLAVLALIVGSVGAYRWRVRHLRRRQRELEETVDERTRALAREMEKTEEHAEHLAELDQAKNRFFANISHEFRTPLTLLLGPLKDALETGESIGEETLRAMQNNAQRLRHLIERLLDLSKLEAGRLTLNRLPTDLTDFTREVVRSMTPLAERKNVSLDYETPKTALSSSVDQQRMEDILRNLIANALKFTPEGGRVRVLTRRQEMDTETWAEIVVRDNGPGIAPDEVDRIFERFHRADASARREHEGTGLGLPLAQRLAKLHGGKILVESERGFGSAFTVRLPVCERERAGDGEHGSAGELQGANGESRGANGDRENGEQLAPESLPSTDDNGGAEENSTRDTRQAEILVVEDDAGVRAYLRKHLEADYAVREAADGQAGLEAVRKAPPDLVLADVMMPEMDGDQLCQAIKDDEELRAIPVVLVTAKATPEDAVEGLSCGADDYVTKPFDVRELKERVARHLETRRALRERYEGRTRLEGNGATMDEEAASFVERVHAAIDERIGDTTLKTGRLAEALAISPRQLRRRLKDALDETPGALIRRRRLERAAARLAQEEDATVSEVAYAVGYTSHSHFSRVFREHFGHPPSEHEAEREAG